MASVKSIDLAWITVSDSEKAKSLFVDVLGLTLHSEAPEYGWMELQGKDGGAMLGIGKSCDGYSEKPGQNAIVTFTVDDVVAMHNVLKSNNVTILGEIMEVPGHVKLLMFSDADGNRYQLAQDLKS